MNSFFRREVLPAGDLQPGGILLVRPPSHTAFAALAGLLLALLVAAMTLIKYTRHVELQGVLEPESGVAKIYAPQNGVLAEVLAPVGTEVRRGDVLLVFSTEHLGRDGGAVEDRLDRSAAAKVASLEAELAATRQSHRDELDNAAKSLNEQRGLAQIQRDQLEGLAQRIQSAQTEVDRYHGLQAQGYASAQMLDNKRAELLDQRVRLQSAQHDLQSTLAEIGRLQRDIAAMPARQQVTLAQLERALEAAQSELRQQQGSHRWSIAAPFDGVVSSLELSPGQTVGPSTPAATLTPRGQPLVAKLYAPSRTIGFLNGGEAVHMKVDAFPFQKFGLLDGQVTHVSRTPVAASELSPASHLAVLMPEAQQAPEPSYAVTAQLAAQAIPAYGRAAPLRPGMQVSATVALDERRLYEWIFEPLRENGHFGI